MSKSEWDDLSWKKKRKNIDKYADRYGIDVNDYNYLNSGRGQFDSGGRERPSFKDLEEDIGRASRNDYDIRRTIEIAKLNGDKDAADLTPGKGGIQAAYDAHKFMKREHEKGTSGDKFKSAQDYASVTERAVEADREEMLSDLASKGDLKAMKKKLLNKALKNKASENNPAEPSDKLAQAQSRIGEAATDPSGLYDKNNHDVPAVDEQNDAAETFVAGYKSDVAKGSKLRQDIMANVGNAANTVTNVYGR